MPVFSQNRAAQTISSGRVTCKRTWTPPQQPRLTLQGELPMAPQTTEPATDRIAHPTNLYRRWANAESQNPAAAEVDPPLPYSYNSDSRSHPLAKNQFHGRSVHFD